VYIPRYASLKSVGVVYIPRYAFLRARRRERESCCEERLFS